MKIVVTNKMITTGQIIAKDFRTAKGVGEAGGGTGIRIYQNYIAGYSSGTTKEFYLDASDGKAYAGGGNVKLDTDGIHIYGEDIHIYEGATKYGKIGGVTSPDAGMILRAEAGKNIIITAGTDTITLTAGEFDLSQNIGVLATGTENGVGAATTRYLGFNIPNLLAIKFQKELSS